jgi:hypothetical protein
MSIELTANFARPARPKSFSAKHLGCVYEYLFANALVRNSYNPILTATILTHDSIDNANVCVTLGINDATILTASHGTENLFETIH